MNSRILSVAILFSVILVLGCTQSSQRAVAPLINPQSISGASAMKLCGDWPDENAVKSLALVSTSQGPAAIYPNSEFVSLALKGAIFYCSSDTPETIATFFKNNYGFSEMSTSKFRNHDPWGYSIIRDAAGSRNFIVYVENLALGSNFVAMIPVQGKTVIVTAGRGNYTINRPVVAKLCGDLGTDSSITLQASLPPWYPQDLPIPPKTNPVGYEPLLGGSRVYMCGSDTPRTIAEYYVNSSTEWDLEYYLGIKAEYLPEDISNILYMLTGKRTDDDLFATIDIEDAGMNKSLVTVTIFESK